MTLIAIVIAPSLAANPEMTQIWSVAANGRPSKLTNIASGRRRVSDAIRQGQCFCGSVEFTVRGEPVAMGYCHCSSCRHWSAGPVNAFTLWPPDAVTVMKGASDIGVYHRTDRSLRKWCTKCGGHLFTEHPKWNLVDVYAAVVPSLAFKPMIHVNYQETVLPIKDGLPKQRDFPKEMGGSGELMAE